MQHEEVDADTIHPRGVVVAALRGGSGKTILSIGIIAAWIKQGISVVPFKKGPDYIDAGWLALAAGRPCYNLDTYLCTQEQVLQSFQTHTSPEDIALIEGNRGLYDGIDIDGSTSTAEIAKLLKLPVILCIDGTKTTRTMAAVISGCIGFDPDTRIKGVVLNHVAGSRHENILRKSIEHYCGIPVIGAVPKLTQQDFPERHMGLIPTPEHKWAKDSIRAMAEIASKYIDLNALSGIAQNASNPEIKAAIMDRASHSIQSPRSAAREAEVRIGIFQDSAFQFYYPDNIEALVSAGAEIVFLSPLNERTLPNIHALYIGGGFPETHAKELSENGQFRAQIKSMVEGGLPVYAECGGLMYLGKELVMDGITYSMTDVLPIVFGLSKKPQGHGYTISRVERENPYFEVGTELRGHEFRYSTVLEWHGDDKDLVFSTKRGTGFINKKDGISYKNVLASYTHLHALGVPSWAASMVRNAKRYKLSQKEKV